MIGSSFDPNSLNFGFNSGGFGNGYGSPVGVAGAGMPMGMPEIPAGNYNPAALDSAIKTPSFNPLGSSGAGVGGTGLGFNMPTFGLALGGLQTIGGLWAAMQAANVAKQQLTLARNTTNANLANQTQSYNTALSDRITSRGVAEGLSPGAVTDYLAKNSLQQRTV